MPGARALPLPLRIAWSILVVAVLALALQPAWAQGPADPPPAFDSNADAKHFRAVTAFTDRETAQLSDVQVVYGIARGRAGNPPLLRARVLDADGSSLLEFDDWHPLWEFSWNADGTQESLLVESSGTGTFVFPFDPDATTLELVDVALGQEVVRGDLSEAVHAFCLANPDDADCQLADLLVEDVTPVSEPPVFLVGEPAPVAIRTTVANAGPDGPAQAVVTRSVETTAGLSVTPAAPFEDERLLEAGAAATALETSYALECLSGGLQTASFTSRIEPVRAATVDPDPANDAMTLDLAVDCALPVSINVKPGGSPNPVDLRSQGVVPVAILTTAVGEYGLPLAFDATTIDPSTLAFGSRDVVVSGGGPPEAHARIHVEDALEHDDLTRDGDLDAVTHYRLRSRGLDSTADEACVGGRTLAGTRFLGCDSVTVR